MLGIKLVYRDKKMFLPLKNSDSSGKADKSRDNYKIRLVSAVLEELSVTGTPGRKMIICM